MGQRTRLSALAFALVLVACQKQGDTPAANTTKVATPAALVAHSEEFRRGLEEVRPGVFVAIGYGIANSILLVGPEGCVVVDAMESQQSGRAVAELFKPHCSKGLKGIIYTHSHPDHVQGAAAFAEVLGNPKVPIYAQAEVSSAMDKLSSELQPIITRRSLMMYGHGLSASEHINVGIGSHLELDDTSQIVTLRPTVTFDDHLEVRIAGLDVVLQHAIGETEDQIFVWLPAQKLLLPGDNLYRAFPNLYTIRGTSYRDPKLWAASLDAMRRLGAATLVPSHTRPILGAEQIQTVLTDYRDAVRYVYDQSIRLMNRGHSPEELQHLVMLPSALAKSPWLQEFYGKPGWSARSVFVGNLGWFDGDVANLQPLPPLARSREMQALAGGVEAFNQKIQQAASAKNFAWVLELSSHALRVDAANLIAKNARLEALKALGEAEANPNARHFYLTQYHELKGDIRLPDSILTPTPSMLAAMPLSSFFDGLAVNLDPAATKPETQVVAFNFTDIQQRWVYIVRNGSSEVLGPDQLGFAPAAQLEVNVSAQVFKEMLAKLRNPALTLAKDFSVVQGSKLELIAFFRQFTPIEAQH